MCLTTLCPLFLTLLLPPDNGWRVGGGGGGLLMGISLPASFECCLGG